MINWQLLSFTEIDNHLLYKMLKLRVDVFVVEQECAYPELDDKDHAKGVRHLIGLKENEVVAVARLIPAGLSYPAVSIGRVVVSPLVRELKIGHQLMTKAVEGCQQLWPNQTIEIGAQAHLEAFYQQHGFEAFSKPYLEDGIPHIDMRRTPLK
ncbi:GCN5 family acetyltransferase [Vibrio sp. UCD-FRSSP16_10]|uniref:GNAT family N-acetyltransferase n=1 Tax=unclassified Vibrio TaxID=2614977 RepID=UPI0007FFEFEB|nr:MULTISPECIES: GNAT family N-acetyltransferase [unclassified Vibrio]OBT16737.1 GCN5 family acetyltransferase [Vibrio sp. UCD-FRSSP16_30]OBT21364.1 GCN5 family acetyltransferase [Vibrio sp. UCD-FRSSP16_10]